MAAPLVSVVIPAYNAAATIRRAVDSVFAQTFHDHEVIVIDDASRDDTAAIVATTYGDRVRLLRLAQNQGESGAMNEGIAAARGELVAFLDADDEWLPEKLAMQTAVLARNRVAVAVACRCRFVDARSRTSRDDEVVTLSVGLSEVWRPLLARTLIAKPCVLARTAALRAAGRFDTALAVGADQDMWIRLAIIGEVEFMPEVLTLVHDTAGSLTKVHADRIDRYMLPMIRGHIARQRHRLSRAEVRAILAERYAAVGRNLYLAGSLLRGAHLLLRAAALGHSVPANLWYLVTAAPPVKALKRQVRRFDGHGWSTRSDA
jgi:glycosyltransferase involved in cell wall biosynthesis